MLTALSSSRAGELHAYFRMTSHRFRVHLTHKARFSSFRLSALTLTDLRKTTMLIPLTRMGFASTHPSSDVSVMKLTNDSYLILMGTKNFTERYYRDKDGWLKISARGRKFRMTAEQVLNHLLPAVAGIKPNLTVKVEHRDLVSRNKRSTRPKTLKVTSHN